MVNYFIINALMLIGMISIAFLIYHASRNYCLKHPLLALIFFGILAGIAGVFLMSQSFETSNGVLIGYRNYNIGIAGLFGGFVPAAIAAVIMFVYRVTVIGLNQTTITLLGSLTMLTIGVTVLSKYVRKLMYQWTYFSLLNIAVTSIALYSLLKNQQDLAVVFAYFYAGHALLAVVIYIILQLYIAFDKTYDKLVDEFILTTHDPLTGLKNRNAMRVLIMDLLQSDPLSGQRSAITINIDNFRLVNDALGQQAGDSMIVALSQKVVTCVGDFGTVYHSGGDEFVVIFDSTDKEMIDESASKIIRDLTKQIIIDNRFYILTASIGICFGKIGETLDQVIEHSYTAMYLAKKQKNTIVTYTKEMEKARTREIILEEDLRSALKDQQLELYFQPIYDVKKGVFNQAEALLRWNHPKFGLVSPVEFIPIAERTRLILPITSWVIKECCLKIAEWKAIGIESVTVSVNLTFISFENRGDELTAHIQNSIEEAGIKPSSLKFEITESTLMHDANEITRVFNNMKQIGVKLALDDFGTGYSSFGYVKDLPLDIIKLDRSLISDICSSEKEQMIVNSMITIIHGLGLETVAEGVETEEQLEKLMQYNCDYIQGFVFSQPLPVNEFVNYHRVQK